MLTEQVSHYKILEHLGSGGMGDVFLALDTRLRRKVVLKFLSRQLQSDKEFQKRLENEALAVASLSHPNVVTIYEIGEADSERFIAMEYIDGASLKQHQTSAEVSSRQLDLADVLDISLQICAGLKAAHDAGVIHRDLKPDNILITGDSRIKILDFGLAKLKDSTALTREQTVMGTLHYMSPEQALGNSAGNATDIWALGVMMYEMLAGRPPFQADYEQAVIYQILHEMPPDLQLYRENIPLPLCDLILKCLEKEVDNRPTSIEAVQEALINIQQGKKSVHEETQRSARQKKSSWRKHYSRIWPAMGIIVLLIFAGFFLNQNIKWPFSDVEEKNYLAVLPFKNISGGKQNQALCDGLVETLTGQLSQLAQFQAAYWVIPSSEILRRGVTSPGEANQWFGVNRVVEGSIQRDGDQIRLTLNLVDPISTRIIGAKVITESLSRSLDFQDKISAWLLEILGIKLDADVKSNLIAGNTTVPGAQEFYLQGYGYLKEYRVILSVENAISLFQRAVQLDTNFAAAYAGLGQAYWRKYELNNEKNWINEAKKNTMRSIDLHNNLPVAHTTLGLIYYGTGKYEEAAAAFQNALDHDPANANAVRNLARVYMEQDKPAQAEATYQRAIKLKPDYWAGYYHLGFFYYRQGEYEKAITQFKFVTELTPLNYRAFSNLGGIYFFVGDNENAKKMFEKSLEISPNYLAYSNLGTIFYNEQVYRKSVEMYQAALEIDSSDYRVWGNLGASYYWQNKEAIQFVGAYKKAILKAESQLRVNTLDEAICIDLAIYYASLSKDTTALNYIQKALDISNSDPEIRVRAAEAYEIMGESDAAFIQLTQAIAEGYEVELIKELPIFEALSPRLEEIK